MATFRREPENPVFCYECKHNILLMVDYHSELMIRHCGHNDIRSINYVEGGKKCEPCREINTKGDCGFYEAK